MNKNTARIMNNRFDKNNIYHDWYDSPILYQQYINCHCMHMFTMQIHCQSYCNYNKDHSLCVPVVDRQKNEDRSKQENLPTGHGWLS